MNGNDPNLVNSPQEITLKDIETVSFNVYFKVESLGEVKLSCSYSGNHERVWVAQKEREFYLIFNGKYDVLTLSPDAMKNSKWALKKVKYNGKFIFAVVLQELFIRPYPENIANKASYKEVHDDQEHIFKGHNNESNIIDAEVVVTGSHQIQNSSTSEVPDNTSIQQNQNEAQSYSNSNGQSTIDSDDLGSIDIDDDFDGWDTNKKLDCLVTQVAQGDPPATPIVYVEKNHSEEAEPTTHNNSDELLSLIGERFGWKEIDNQRDSFRASLVKRKPLDIEIMKILLHTFLDKVLVDPKFLCSFDYLRGCISYCIGDQLSKQSTVDNNEILHKRYNKILSEIGFNDIGQDKSENFYFNAFCLILNTKFSLDLAQICNILDFIKVPKLAFCDLIEFLLHQHSENKLMAYVREAWFDKRFIGLDRLIVNKLKDVPWTVPMLEIFLTHFSNVTLSQLDSLLNIPRAYTVSTTEFMNSVLGSTNTLDLEAKLSQVDLNASMSTSFRSIGGAKYQELFNLLLREKPSTYIINCMDNFTSKVTPGFENSAAEYFYILCCQVSNYQLQVEDMRFLEQIKPNCSLNNFLKVYREKILYKVFQKEASEIDVDTICHKILPNRSWIKEEYTLFRFIQSEVKSLNLASSYETLIAHMTDTYYDNYGDFILSILGSFEIEEDNEVDQIKEHILSRIQYHAILITIISALQHVKDPDFDLRPVQYVTLIYTLLYREKNRNGVLSQVYTGEGKTLLVAVIAAYNCMISKHKFNMNSYGYVDVITSSKELSMPQMKENSEFYRYLGIEVAAFDESIEDSHYSNYNIVYGTVSDFIRLRLSSNDPLQRTTKNLRAANIVVIDEVDNMLFDRSNAMIQVCSVETTALTPLIYPLMFEIYFHVKSVYSTFSSPEVNSGVSLSDRVSCTVDYLKSHFKEEYDESTPSERYNDLIGISRERVFLDSFPCYDFRSKSTFLDVDRLIYIQQMDMKIAFKYLKSEIIKRLPQARPKFYYQHQFGEFVDIWVYFDDSMYVAELLKIDTLEFTSHHIGIKFLKPIVEEASNITFESLFPCNIKSDLEAAKSVARKLDEENGIEGGMGRILTRLKTCQLPNTNDIFGIVGDDTQSTIELCNALEEKSIEALFNSYISQKKELDWVMGYLRKVHLFSYYTCKHFSSIADLLKERLQPQVRDYMTSADEFVRQLRKSQNAEQHPTYNTNQKVLDYIESEESYNFRKEIQEQRDLSLRFKFLKLIVTLPVSIRRYCFLQFDTWVANCYHSIMHVTDDVNYVTQRRKGIHVKIDSNNTGTLQKNTHLMNGVQQFISMKENLIISPISLTSSFQGIAAFFKSYTHIFGFTGTLGNKQTRDFLKEEYKVSIMDIPSNFRKRSQQILYHEMYRCFEFEGLVLKNTTDWLKAICESVRQQLCLRRPVLIFCKTVRQLHKIIKPVIEKMCKEMGFTVPIDTYDATTTLSDSRYIIDSTRVILATNIAGRGTDLRTTREVESYGGLHICITFMPKSERFEKQCSGRTARSGKLGTAQLVVVDKDGRSIHKLREKRNKENFTRIQEAKIQVANLKLSTELSLEVSNLVREKILLSYRHEEEQLRMNALTTKWHKILPDIQNKVGKGENYLPQKRRKFIQKQKLKNKVELSNERMNRSANLMVDIPKAAYYNRVCSSLLTQRHAFWMNRHCFINNSTGKLTEGVQEKFERCMRSNQKLFTEKNHFNFEHHIFTAQEAFRILFNRGRVPDENYQHFFENTGIAVWKNVEPNKFAGMALYYYAGYKIQLALKNGKFKRHNLENIKNILKKSQEFIDNEILSIHKSMIEMLFPGNIVYMQLHAAYTAFKALVDSIGDTIESIDTAIRMSRAIVECRFISFEDYSTVEDGNNIAQAVSLHAKAFGYFGKFFIVIAESSAMQEYSLHNLLLGLVTTITSKFQWHRNVLDFLRSITNTPQSMSIETTSPTVSIRITSSTITCRLNALDYVEMTSAYNRLGMFLTVSGQSDEAIGPLARALLMKELTSKGIEQSKSAFSLESMDMKSMNVLNNIVDHEITFAKQNANVKKKYSSLVKQISDLCAEQDIKYQQLAQFFRERLFKIYQTRPCKRLFMPCFKLDAFNSNFVYETKLLRCLRGSTYEQAVRRILSNDAIHDVNKNIEKNMTVLKLYTDLLQRTVKNVLDEASSSYKSIKGEYSDKNQSIAENKYRNFIHQVTKLFMVSARTYIEKYFKEETESLKAALILEGNNVRKRIGEHELEVATENASRMDACPLCNPLIPLEVKLQNLAEAFNLIVVYVRVPIETQVFIPQKPHGCVRALYDPQNKNWAVKYNTSDCLLDLFTKSFGKPDFRKLVAGIDNIESYNLGTILNHVEENDFSTNAWNFGDKARIECMLNQYDDVSTVILQTEGKSTLFGFHRY